MYAMHVPQDPVEICITETGWLRIAEMVAVEISK